jgi:predicted nucleotidyltransferase component of viral defense system
MISKEELKKIAKKSDLNLYQQEKDYLLHLFLYNYYRKFENAVFKGGIGIRYLYGLNRFSEDLDFNLKITLGKFRGEVEKTLKEIELSGIKNYFIKEETFNDAYTCEIAFQGPLFTGEKQTRNKFRLNAGGRTGIVNEPEWKLIASEYPETPRNFMVLAMEEQEILAEKIIALANRNKGRDLYDVWFLLNAGVKIAGELIEKKSGRQHISTEIKTLKFVSNQEYEI